LPAPLGVGRGKHYSEQHLATLVGIRDQQAAGTSLEDIAARRQGVEVAREPARSAPLPLSATSQSRTSQSSWTRVVLFDGVELHVRGRRLSEAQVEQLTTQITRVIGGDAP
jgi:hypothetical protein